MREVRHTWEPVGFEADQSGPNIFRCRREGCHMSKATSGTDVEYSKPDGEVIVVNPDAVPQCSGEAGRCTKTGQPVPAGGGR